MGYYGDIYMKQFIRKWKQKTYENIQRRKDRINAIEVMEKKRLIDVDNIVLEFL
jgi:ribose 5-phosphate isomerase RpiB